MSRCEAATLGRQWRTRYAAGLLAAGLVVAGAPGPAAAAAQEPAGFWWRQAWQMDRVASVADGSGVTVAVADTGVDASVPELSGAVVPGLDLHDPNNDARVDYDEDSGHGTGMASLIAARPGHSELVGAAPGATIYPIATHGTLNAFHEDFFDMIDAAMQADAGVINFATAGGIGHGGACPEEIANAVRYALSQDLVVVAAPGNVDTPDIRAPASCPGVITVGALTEDLTPWDRTNRSEYTDVGAPGVGITVRRDSDEFRYTSGTSNSTALVSGTVALLRQQFPEASAYEIVTRLLATAQDVGQPGYDEASGHGMVRPYEALTADVPADAPNPVYDPLGSDLQDLQWSEPTPDVTPAGPEFDTVAEGDDGDSGAATTVLLVAGGVLLVVAVAGVVFLTMRRRRPAEDPSESPEGSGTS